MYVIWLWGQLFKTHEEMKTTQRNLQRLKESLARQKGYVLASTVLLFICGVCVCVCGLCAVHGGCVEIKQQRPTTRRR